MMSVLLLLVLVGLRVNICCAIDFSLPPADWVNFIDNGDMFYTASLPAAGYNPNIGNGFLATNLGCFYNVSQEEISYDSQLGHVRCGTVFMGGVYNGNNSVYTDLTATYQNTSHRALLPGIHSYYVDTTQSGSNDYNVTWLGGGLYLPNGTFHNRSYVYHPDYCPTGAVIEIMQFIHRFYRSLMIFQIRIIEWDDHNYSQSNEKSNNTNTNRFCIVPVNDCNFNGTNDFEWNQWIQQHTDKNNNNNNNSNSSGMYNDNGKNGRNIRNNLNNIIIRNFTTRQAESKGTKLTSVGVAFQDINSSVMYVNNNVASIKLIENINDTVSYYSVWHNSLQFDTNITNNSTKLAIHSGDELNEFLTQYTFDELFFKHCESMNALWNLRIEMRTENNINNTITKGIYGSLYYILNSMRADYPFSTSPGGLATNDYYGHVFWDAETWMLPSLAAIYPSLVLKSMLKYRLNRLPNAQSFANTNLNLNEKESEESEKLEELEEFEYIAQFPWESAFTGDDICQVPLFGSNEIHITADIGLAIQLLFKFTMHNRSWILDNYDDFGNDRNFWNLLNFTCNYFSKRVTEVENGNYYTLYNVVTADESAGEVNTSAYTNTAAVKLLNFCSAYGSSIGDTNTIDSIWSDIANKMMLLRTDSTKILGNQDGKWIHLEYTGYNGSNINQADVILLYYPLQYNTYDNFWILNLVVDNNTSININENDLLYYETRTSGTGTRQFFTGDSSYSVAWLKLASTAKYFNKTLSDWYIDKSMYYFKNAYYHMDLEHYFIWKETMTENNGGNLNFLTGAGGLLQNIVFGYININIDYDELLLNPLFPIDLDISMIRLNTLIYNGIAFNLTFYENKMVFKRYSRNDTIKMKQLLMEDFLMIDNISSSSNNVTVNVEIVTPVIYYNETSNMWQANLRVNDSYSMNEFGSELVINCRHLTRITVQNSTHRGTPRVIIGGGGGKSEDAIIYYWIEMGCIIIVSVAALAVLIAYFKDIVRWCKILGAKVCVDKNGNQVSRGIQLNLPKPKKNKKFDENRKSMLGNDDDDDESNVIIT